MEQAAAKLLEAQKKAVADLLSLDQAKRLKQLEVQQSCPKAFSANLTSVFGSRGSGQVAKDLKLTNQQSSVIDHLIDEATLKIYAHRNRLLFGPNLQPRKVKPTQEELQEYQKKVVEAYKKTMAEILKNLTKDQLAQWQEMSGEPFPGILPGGGTYPDIDSPLIPSLTPKEPEKKPKQGD